MFVNIWNIPKMFDRILIICILNIICHENVLNILKASSYVHLYMAWLLLQVSISLFQAQAPGPREQEWHTTHRRTEKHMGIQDLSLLGEKLCIHNFLSLFFLLTTENRKYWSIWSVLQFPFVILIFQFPANLVLRKSNKKSDKSIEQTFYIEFSLHVSDRMMRTKMDPPTLKPHLTNAANKRKLFQVTTNNWRVDIFKRLHKNNKHCQETWWSVQYHFHFH